jgi:predicted enzyme related to lactoylglutathione lyase
VKPRRFDVIHLDRSATGRFCWVDLAATEVEKAKVFYGRLFRWSFHDQPANGGSFTRLRLADQDVGSLYQLDRGHLARGVPSHWTPYVQVDDVDDAAQRAVLLGGQVLVRPFEVTGIARIALILDSVGAPVGLWESSEKSARDYA